MPGERGPPGQDSYGPTGPPGNPGKTGQRGDPGRQGAQGNPGIKGPGTVGAQGDPGSPGVPGEKGDRGSLGAQGNPGVDGQKGQVGSKGAQGVPGVSYPGSQGAQGVQGNPGQNGNPGNQGVQGAQGNPGIPGGVGAQGSIGNPGNQGPQGPYGFGATKYIYGEVVGPTVFNDSINETLPNYITLQSDGTQTRTYGILIVQIAGTVVNFPEPVTAQFNIYVSSDLPTLFSAEMIVPITPTAVVSSITQYRVLASQSFYMILPPTGTPFNIYITIANSYIFGFPSLELSAITGTDWFNAVLLHY